jgi:hypothetical protein
MSEHPENLLLEQQTPAAALAPCPETRDRDARGAFDRS